MEGFIFFAAYVLVIYAIATRCRKKNGEPDYNGFDMIIQDHIVILKYILNAMKKKG